MTIDEAIEIKQRTGDAFLNTDPEDLEEADKLSIEALKRIKSERAAASRLLFQELPGETKE